MQMFSFQSCFIGPDRCVVTPPEVLLISEPLEAQCFGFVDNTVNVFFNPFLQLRCLEKD